MALTMTHQQETIMLESLLEHVGSPALNDMEMVIFIMSWSILLFLLISSLITKCRLSCADSNVRRESQRIRKKLDKEIKHNQALAKKGHWVHEEGAAREGGGLEEGDTSLEEEVGGHHRLMVLTGSCTPGYRGSPVTPQNFGYDWFPPVASSWGAKYPIPDMVPPPLAE
jgi:hypothetical protein